MWPYRNRMSKLGFLNNLKPKNMAQPTKKGQRVIVRNDQDLIFTVDNFLGAKEQKLHDNILDAMKEKPGCNAGDILVSWNVPGAKHQGSALAKDCKVLVKESDLVPSH